MEELYEYFETIQSIPEKTKDFLKEISEVKEFKKKECIHEAGTYGSVIYIIKKGIVRMHTFENGVDTTAGFQVEGDSFSAFDSIFTDQPSRYFITALEDTSCWSISFEDLERLYSSCPEMERIGRLLTMRELIRLANRLTSLQFHNMEERYYWLEKYYPHLIGRVSFGQLASFLGMSQETLSRVRTKITKKRA